MEEEAGTEAEGVTEEGRMTEKGVEAKTLTSQNQSLNSETQSLVSEEEGDTPLKEITLEKVEKNYDLENRISLRKAAMANSWGWKHGKYSRYKPIPPIAYDVMAYIDQHDLDADQAKEYLAYLIKDNLKRIEIGKVFEMADGGVQDPKLSTLIKDTAYLLFMFQGKMFLPSGDYTQNLAQINVEGDMVKEMDNLTPEERKEFISALRGITEKSKDVNAPADK